MKVLSSPPVVVVFVIAFLAIVAGIISQILWDIPIKAGFGLCGTAGLIAYAAFLTIMARKNQ